MGSLAPAAQLLVALGVFMAGIGVLVWAGSRYPGKKGRSAPPATPPRGA